MVPGGAYVFMRELIKEYLDWKGTYAPRASNNYRIWLRNFLEVCGEKPLDKYDVSDLVKYRNWLDERFSQSSIQLAIVVIKNFLQYCIMQNRICISPKLIRLPKVHQKSHRAVTESEYYRIIAEVPKNGLRPFRDLVMIRVLWDTGVRVSELCSINLSDISEDRTTTVIQTKKSGTRRVIMWSKETHRLLMKYIIQRKQFKENRSTALFIGRTKKNAWSLRITPRSVQRAIRQFADRAGILEKVTPHSFRHGWAHKRRDQNAPLAFIQKGLGHSSPISTFIYEQYNDVDFERNASAYLKPAA